MPLSLFRRKGRGSHRPTRADFRVERCQAIPNRDINDLMLTYVAYKYVVPHCSRLWPAVYSPVASQRLILVSWTTLTRGWRLVSI